MDGGIFMGYGELSTIEKWEAKMLWRSDFFSTLGKTSKNVMSERHAQKGHAQNMLKLKKILIFEQLLELIRRSRVPSQYMHSMCTYTYPSCTRTYSRALCMQKKAFLKNKLITYEGTNVGYFGVSFRPERGEEKGDVCMYSYQYVVG